MMEGSTGRLSIEKDAEPSFVFRQTLFSCDTTYIYKIPPRTTSLSYRAGDWNIEKPFLTGAIRVIQENDDGFIRLLEPALREDGSSANYTQFAQVSLEFGPHDTMERYVETVVDSSRYFALRVQDAQTGRHAFVGIGFADRQHAFDFKASVQEFAKYKQRQLQADEMQAHETEISSKEGSHSADFKISEGETLRLSLKGCHLGRGRSASKESDSVEETKQAFPTSATVLAPPPPPPPQSSKDDTPKQSGRLSPETQVRRASSATAHPSDDNQTQRTETTSQCFQGQEVDDDWGDFTSA